MSETEIKVVLGTEEAEKKLAELDGSLDEAADEAERLDKATKGGTGPAVRRARRAPGAGGAGGGLGATAGKAFAGAAAAVIAVKVAEVVVSALGQKLESYGFSEIGQGLQRLSEKATAITSAIAQLQGAASAIVSVADPFAQSGVSLPPEVLLSSAQLGAARARRDAQLSSRKQARGLLAYGSAAGDILLRLGRGL